MAKVLFVQDIDLEFVGIQTLSSCLKSKGHEVDLFSASTLKKQAELFDYVKQTKPDLVAFSIPSMGYEWTVNLAKKIKKEIQIYCAFGGPHPTYYPDFIETDGVEITCVGEGEEAMVELADALGKKDFEKIKTIKNIYFKDDNGKIYKNELRDLVDVDSLPWPDRELHYKMFPHIQKFSNKRVVATRGCPYNCSFCFNTKYKEMYKGKGSYIRRRNPKKIIEEIKYVRDHYGFKTLSFADENFTTDRKWLYELLEMYKKEIGIPFMVLGRFNEIDDELARKLKEAGCFFISVGLESGNDFIRNKVLNKGVTRAQIIKGATAIKKYGIGLFTYNMLGLPHETIKEAFETLELNAKIGVDITIPTLLQPIKGTKLCDYIEEKNLLADGFDLEHLKSHWQGVTVKTPHARQIENLQNLFMLGIWYPSLIPLMKILVRAPKNPLYKGFLNFSLLMKYKRTRMLGWFELVNMAWKARKNV